MAKDVALKLRMRLLLHCVIVATVKLIKGQPSQDKSGLIYGKTHTAKPCGGLLKKNILLSEVNCKHCFGLIIVPPSRVWRTNFCSSECRDLHKDNIVQERKRSCAICQKEFFPRLQQIKNGAGIYCSVKCRNIGVLPKLQTKEAKQRSKHSYQVNLANGLIVHPKAEDHPRWKGGISATVQRRIADGRANDSVKRYRKNNPERVREWSATRLKNKTGRLPRGTVSAKLQAQNYLCVICNTSVAEKYHVDHIFPLSKGGKHEPSNIQILCPSCNVRKSNKILDIIGLR